MMEMSLDDPEVETVEEIEASEPDADGLDEASTDLAVIQAVEPREPEADAEDVEVVIEFAGKQSIVRVGDFINAVVATEGELPIEPDPIVHSVLAAYSGDEVVLGSPTIEGATVGLESIGTLLGPKTVSFKRRRRKNSSKVTRGGRQRISEFVVTAIDVPGHFNHDGAETLDDKSAALG